MTKKRIDWIDAAKSFAIVLMIVGHTVTNSSLITWIFSFHMPLFIILSGITYKKIETKEDLKNNIKKYLRKIFIPYALTLVICCLIESLKTNGITDAFVIFKEIVKYFVWGNGCDYSFLGTSFAGIGPIWFLIVLFFSKIIFDCINLKLNISKNKEKNALIIYCFSLIAGIELGHLAWYPQGFDLMFIFLFYLYIGSLLGRYMDKNQNHSNLCFAIAFLIWTICLGYKINIELAVRSYPFGVLCVIESIAASYCIIELCKLLVQNSILRRIMTKVGAISLTILLVHSIDLVLINWELIFSNEYIITVCRIIFDVLVAMIYVWCKKKVIYNILNLKNIRRCNCA